MDYQDQQVLAALRAYLNAVASTVESAAGAQSGLFAKAGHARKITELRRAGTQLYQAVETALRKR